jgi:Do/DeqQ family serine protease
MILFSSKQKKIFLSCLSLVCLKTISFGADVQNGTTIAPMLVNVLPSVVQIIADVKQTSDEPIFDENSPPSSPNQSIALGTGIILDAKNGIIVTNAHVVKDAEQILVALKNGNRYYAEVLAKQPDMDIAVLHINAQGLKALPMASMHNVHVGDAVAAVGSPFGLTQTVTTGTISALDRSEPHIGQLSDFIQTDASINPGNSGGPLVNMQGQMVGMNTALLGPSMSIGLGFAIPVNIVEAIATQLVKYGNVQTGVLGVVVQPLSQSLAQAINSPISEGALVTQVLAGSAAAKAGIKADDIIASVDGMPADSALQLKTLVSLHRPQSQVAIVYWHNGKEKTVNAILKSAKDTENASPALPFVAGLQLQNMNGLSSEGDSLQGLLVINVEDHSQALLAGIVPTDVIVEIDHQSSEDLSEMKKILAVVPEKQEQVLVKLYRDGKFMYVTLQR